MGCFSIRPQYGDTWRDHQFEPHVLETLSSETIYTRRDNLDQTRIEQDVPPQNYRSGLFTNNIKSNQCSTKEREGPVSIYTGFTNDQWRNRSVSLQNGHSTQMYEVFQERNVGCKDRSQKGLLPYPYTPRLTSSIRIPIRRNDFRISLPPFRSRSSSNYFHKDIQRHNHRLEKERDDGLYLHRRYVNTGLLSRRTLGPHYDHNSRSNVPRLAASIRKMHPHTHSNNRVPRYNSRFCVRPYVNPNRQSRNSNRCIKRTYSSGKIEKVYKLPIRSQIYWQNGVLDNSQSLHRTVLAPSQERYAISGPKEKLESIYEDQQRSQEGSRNSSANCAREYWSLFRVRYTKPSRRQFRCIPSRLWNSCKLQHFGGQIQSDRRNTDSYQSERASCGSLFFPSCRSTQQLPSKYLFRVQRRQHNSTQLFKEGLRNVRPSGLHSEGDLDNPTQKKVVDFQSCLHPIPTKQYRRSVESPRRLALLRRTSRPHSTRIRLPYGRQIRDSKFRSHNSIQQLARERCISVSVGNGLSQLLRPSIRSNSTNNSTHHQIEGSRDITSSQLALLTLVLSTAEDIRKKYKCSKKFAYNRALYRIVQQIRKSGNDCLQSEWQTVSQLTALSVIVSLAPSTLTEYSKIYGLFSWFVTAFDFQKESDSVLDYFYGYLVSMKKAYLIQKAKAAVQFFADLEGWQLKVSSRFGRVVKGSTKIWSLVDRKKISPEECFIFSLTSAILVIGFRLFARPGELCELKWSDVEMDNPKPGWININLAGHKTDFFFNDRPHPIDPVQDSNTFCPIQILTTYMNLVRNFKSPDSPLFSFKDNQYLTTTQISELIRNAIRQIDSTVKVSGHSLRIGASTEISSKGMPIEVNKIMGRWVSDKSVLRYSRRIGFAESDFSTKLFNTRN
ncbi:hypothetical protein C9374_002794 [Naegleria lovaniensis]|uniref:Tyr recombinase domain-containing protein n=1 Tax=Naegleria lovaniensis TaxID=51637 RepID=A0AA88KL37_NAELO|nr:uncharacterized protein C9374_002794 [Naegleria lovaniensis]KAG2386348.1 hypothetical protein C9374_002794 [Naegleria lovaniensis]